MEIFISIGERLRRVRDEMGMSQSEFAAVAERAGVPGATRQSQANYEKGRQMPSAAYLAAIGEAGADVTYIVTGRRSGQVALPRRPPDEELLLEAYRALKPAVRKKLLASLLTGGKSGLDSKRDGVNVTGSENRIAGRDYHEGE
jgi:transcriptional regulator with XRE-family HTH domain